MINRIAILVIIITFFIQCESRKKYDIFKLYVQNHSIKTRNSFALINEKFFLVHDENTERGEKFSVFGKNTDNFVTETLIGEADHMEIVGLSGNHLVLNTDPLRESESVYRYDLQDETYDSICHGSVIAVGDRILLAGSKNQYYMILEDEVRSLPVQNEFKGEQIIHLTYNGSIIEIASITQKQSSTIAILRRINLTENTEEYQENIIANKSVVAHKISYGKDFIFMLSFENEVFKFSKKNLLDFKRVYKAEGIGTFDKLEIVEDRLIILQSFDDSYSLQIIDINTDKDLLTEKVISAYFKSRYDVLLGVEYPAYNNLIFLTNEQDLVEVTPNGKLVNNYKVSLPISHIIAASDTHLLLYAEDLASYYLMDKASIKVFK